MNFANYLTIFRLFVSPIFFWIYAQYSTLGLIASLALLGLLVLSELSDFLDGYVARKYNQVTNLGKILDPMADSLARLGVFLIFTLPPIHLPMLVVFVFLYRDSMISSLRTICALRGFTLAARTSGKIKAIVQAGASFCTILSLILHSLGMVSLSFVQVLSLLVCGFAALFSVFAGVEYIFSNKGYIRSALTSKG